RAKIEGSLQIDPAFPHRGIKPADAKSVKGPVILACFVEKRGSEIERVLPQWQFVLVLPIDKPEQLVERPAVAERCECIWDFAESPGAMLVAQIKFCHVAICEFLQSPDVTARKSFLVP